MKEILSQPFLFIELCGCDKIKVKINEEGNTVNAGYGYGYDYYGWANYNPAYQGYLYNGNVGQPMSSWGGAPVSDQEDNNPIYENQGSTGYGGGYGGYAGYGGYGGIDYGNYGGLSWYYDLQQICSDVELDLTFEVKSYHTNSLN